MRIVSGKYGGRVLKAPKGDAIRPTSDKLRGAIFNMLRSRDVVDGAFVMDCFCGTGALGIEALSNGAAHCVFMDSARDSLALAKENAAALKISAEAEFILKDAAKMGQRAENTGPRTLVFLDPPYNKNLVPKALEALQKDNWLATECFLVIETEKNFAAAEASQGFTILDERLYGETKLILAKESK